MGLLDISPFPETVVRLTPGGTAKLLPPSATSNRLRHNVLLLLFSVGLPGIYTFGIEGKVFGFHGRLHTNIRLSEVRIQ